MTREIGFALLFACALVTGSARADGDVSRPRFKLATSSTVECSNEPKHSCELSAAVCLGASKPGGATILAASDKPLAPGAPESIMSGRVVGSRFVPQGIARQPTFAANKVEALAATPDGRYVLAFTACDRVNAGFGEVVVWAADSLHFPGSHVRVQDATTGRDADLRAAIVAVYRGKFGASVDYVKLEGAAFLDKDRLLLGIHSYGQSYTQFSDVFHLISIKVRRDGDGPPILLANTVLFEADFSDRIRASFGRDFGLSEIALDSQTGNIWGLVTFELGDEGKKRLEGRLVQLVVSKSGPLRESKLLVADDESNAPLVLDGKPEGFCEYATGEFVVFYDDDRELTAASKKSPRVRLSQARYELYARNDRQPSILVLPAKR